ncbi:hypothetical protein QUA82_34380 [Microcoleus sp. F8-D3]
MQLLLIVRHYYRSSAIIIDRPPLFSIVHHYSRSPATILDHPPLFSIAMQRQSSTQLINNDNRDRVRESACGGLSHSFPI